MSLARSRMSAHTAHFLQVLGLRVDVSNGGALCNAEHCNIHTALCAASLSSPGNVKRKLGASCTICLGFVPENRHAKRFARQGCGVGQTGTCFATFTPFAELILAAWTINMVAKLRHLAITPMIHAHRTKMRNAKQANLRTPITRHYQPRLTRLRKWIPDMR